MNYFSSSKNDVKEDLGDEKILVPEAFANFNRCYEELYRKVLGNKKHRNDKVVIEKLRLIHDTLDDLVYDMEDMIDDLDRQTLSLSPEEDQRIQDKEVVNRSIENLGPLPLLSYLYESGFFRGDGSEGVKVLE